MPIQTPRPPVWIPGGGSIETWEWCINNDFLYAYLTYFGYMAGISVIDGYWETVERLGAEFNPYRCAFLQFVGVAENDAEAEKLYAEPAQYFYNRCFHLDPGFVGPPGYTSIETMRAGIQSAVRTAARKVQGQDLAWKDIVDSGCVVAGSPQTVIDRLNDMADRMKVGHVMLLMHFGNMKHETVLYNTTRFAKEVAPKLRHRFNEYEDKWWPKDTLKEMPSDSTSGRRWRRNRVCFVEPVRSRRVPLHLRSCSSWRQSPGRNHPRPMNERMLLGRMVAS